jgi:hypothetical protein
MLDVLTITGTLVMHVIYQVVKDIVAAPALMIHRGGQVAIGVNVTEVADGVIDSGVAGWF